MKGKDGVTNQVTGVLLNGGLKVLLQDLRQLVIQARRQVSQTADALQVQTYWEVGRNIVEFEQGGADRADYGKRLPPTLAAHLTAEFGKGFDVTNLRNMRAFYRAFPIRDAPRRELSWTHYRTLLRLDEAPIRQWYMNESANQGWSTRVLERQVNLLYYERLLSSRDRKAVESEAKAAASSLARTPREFVRDPVSTNLFCPQRRNCGQSWIANEPRSKNNLRPSHKGGLQNHPAALRLKHHQQGSQERHTGSRRYPARHIRRRKEPGERRIEHHRRSHGEQKPEPAREPQQGTNKLHRPQQRRALYFKPGLMPA